MDLENLKSPALSTVGVAGGAIGAGVLASKVSFFNENKLGKYVMFGLGCVITAMSKSEIVKGFGLGMAAKGALQIAEPILGTSATAGLAGAMGEVVQDANGYTYIVDGLGNMTPYELPVYETEEVVEGGEDEVSGAEDEVSGVF